MNFKPFSGVIAAFFLFFVGFAVYAVNLHGELSLSGFISALFNMNSTDSRDDAPGIFGVLPAVLIVATFVSALVTGILRRRASIKEFAYDQTRVADNWGSHSDPHKD